ncbi:putative Atrial natriuretic peptide receptor 1 [Hypsibius exemplaris]|uniref:Atrial natriuretic peptide receptor 1 n=1 Tax=Hypsibius exemplaris TaxID=2072580 RepID=A0A1W0WBL7_HYPEX|nr:putative Atrial natriuretic peptide receptor 1 [Hypsibius exemplaris]
MVSVLIYYVGCFGVLIASLHALPRIALASTTIKVPEANTTNLDAIQSGGPAVDLGVEHLKTTYGKIFNFSHTYLMDESRPSVAFLLDDVENFAAGFFYENSKADGLAFLSTCTVEQNKILSFTRATETLLGCSVGSVPVSPVESNGHCFGLAVYPGSVAMKFIYDLLMAHQWTNIVGLVDLPRIATEPLSRGFRALFQERFNGRDASMKYIRYSDLMYDSSLGYPEIEKALRTLSQNSRIVFLFGSGKSFLMVLRTAHRLGMTNGEYVFFMLAFNRFGSSMDNIDDAWWKVTNDKDDSPIASRGYVSRATIVISFLSPYGDSMDPPIHELRSRIVDTARRNYNMTHPRGVPRSVFATYEMYVIYGMVLNETYAQTGRILSGLELGTVIRNQTFRLNTGLSSFSAGGERSVKMIGEIVDPRTGNYARSLLYDPVTGEISNTSDVKSFWPGGAWPPPNEPKCGYMGNNCSDSSQSQIELALSVGITVSVVLGVIIGSFALVRHLRRPPNDTQTWWILSPQSMEQWHCYSR